MNFNSLSWPETKPDPCHQTLPALHTDLGDFLSSLSPPNILSVLHLPGFDLYSPGKTAGRSVSMVAVRYLQAALLAP